MKLFYVLIPVLLLSHCDLFGQKDYYGDQEFWSGIKYYNQILPGLDKGSKDYATAVADITHYYAEIADIYDYAALFASQSQSLMMDKLTKYYGEISDEEKKEREMELGSSLFFSGMSNLIYGYPDKAIEYFNKSINLVPAELKPTAELWLAAAKAEKAGSDGGDKRVLNTPAKNQTVESERLFLRAFLNGKNKKYDYQLSDFKLANDREIKNLLLPAVYNGDYENVLTLWSKLSFDEPYMVLNKGDKENEVNYYDPSIYFVLASAADYLSYFYANVYNGLVNKYNLDLDSHYYRARLFWRTGQYAECKASLAGRKDTGSLLLLLRCLLALGEKAEADELLNSIKQSDKPLLISGAAKELAASGSDYFSQASDLITQAQQFTSKLAWEERQPFGMNIIALEVAKEQYESAFSSLSNYYLNRYSKKSGELGFANNIPKFLVMYNWLILERSDIDKILLVTDDMAKVRSEYPSINGNIQRVHIIIALLNKIGQHSL